VSFLVAKSAQTTVRENCHAQTGPSCDGDAAGASKIRTWETIGWVAGGLGLAGVGVGILLSTRGAADDAKPTALLRVRSLGTGSVGLSWEGRF